MPQAVTRIVTITVPAEHRARAEELWTPMIDDIKKTEAGKVTFNLNFHEESSNYIVIETYSSEAEMERYNGKPFHMEISGKVRDDGLVTAVDFKQMRLVMGTSKGS